MKSLVLFNNKGGVGKTTLNFHIAHMLARKDKRTIVIDCDPQCNISANFLDEEQLSDLWQGEPSSKRGKTVFDCVDLVRRGKGEVVAPELVEVSDNLWLLPGHLNLSIFEQTLAEEWPKKMANDNERALDVTTALDLLSHLAAEQVEADIVIFDVGPSLGALNRATILACDAVVLPLSPDLFSLQGLKNVGASLVDWRTEWERTRQHHFSKIPQAKLPPHAFRPIGYIVQQHIARADRPVWAYRRWSSQIAAIYHQHVSFDTAPEDAIEDASKDPECIGMVKHQASLAPLAQEARKPMFDLKQADGVNGGQLAAVTRCRELFSQLTDKVLERLARLPSL